MRWFLYLISEIGGAYLWFTSWGFPPLGFVCVVLALHSAYMLLSGDAFKEESAPSQTPPPSPPPSYREPCARCRSYNHSTAQHDEIARTGWR